MVNESGHESSSKDEHILKRMFVVFPESCNGRAPKRNGRPTGRRSEQQRRCATDCRKWKKKKTKKKKKKGKTCDTQAHFKLET
ncbi:hypothetical protein DAPPUDRAFT_279192, partial [Daphnia pulex]